MSNKPTQDNKAKNKKILTIIGVIVVLVLLVGVFGGSGNDKTTDTTKKADTETTLSKKEQKEQARQELVEKVEKALADAGDDTINGTNGLASFYNGRQGEVVEVKSKHDGEVIIDVSTYFDKAGKDDEGGQQLAYNLMNVICTDVPELKSLYVHSTSTGLDSRSVYASSLPICKTRE